MRKRPRPDFVVSFFFGWEGSGGGVVGGLGPYEKHYNMLGSILGSPYFGKLPLTVFLEGVGFSVYGG